MPQDSTVERLPRLHAEVLHMDSMRSRTKRIRTEFFQRRNDPSDDAQAGKPQSTAPSYGSISQRERRFLKPSHIQQPDPCLGDLKYYTEVTIRPPKKEFQFNALNRNTVLAPQWNTPRPNSGLYSTTELPKWEAQVLKAPQEVQSYSRQMRVTTPRVSGTNSDDWNATMRTMFRPVDRFDVPAREYYVDPEWVSEDVRIAKARAERFLQAKAV